MGRIPWASEVFNCSAPDTGNMELLHLCATPEQRRDWLLPLLHGEIRSCIGITEPDVASSDPTNLQTTIRRDGGDYVINGRKWFTTGALHPNARFVIVMGLSDPSEDAGRHARHSMVIVPFDTPGVEIVRNLPIMGHHSPEGHCEVVFRDVRVPRKPSARQRGRRLCAGPGAPRAGAGASLHAHHRPVRTGARTDVRARAGAPDVRPPPVRLCQYSGLDRRVAHGDRPGALLVLRAAWLMDTRGNKAAHVDVSAIKVVAANLQTRVATVPSRCSAPWA
jgi:acyl-CoA dehydrogenase